MTLATQHCRFCASIQSLSCTRPVHMCGKIDTNQVLRVPFFTPWFSETPLIIMLVRLVFLEGYREENRGGDALGDGQVRATQRFIADGVLR